VRGDVLIDSKLLLVTDFMNLKSKPVQSFRNAQRYGVRIYIHRVSTHIYLYLYCISKKQVEKLLPCPVLDHSLMERSSSRVCFTHRRSMDSPNMATKAAEDTRRRRQHKAIAEQTSAGPCPKESSPQLHQRRTRKKGEELQLQPGVLERSMIHHSTYLTLKTPLA
jgi:hypothetical protein